MTWHPKGRLTTSDDRRVRRCPGRRPVVSAGASTRTWPAIYEGDLAPARSGGNHIETAVQRRGQRRSIFFEIIPPMISENATNRSP